MLLKALYCKYLSKKYMKCYIKQHVILVSDEVGKSLLVKHISKMCCFSSVLAMIFHACMSVKNCAAKTHAVHAEDK